MRFHLIFVFYIVFFLISLIEPGDARSQGEEIISDDVVALKNKGDALYDLGQYQEAIGYYDKVLAIDPNDVYALINKGSALDDLGQYEQAIEYYDKVLAIDPNNVDSLNNKGEALDELGRHQEAAAWFCTGARASGGAAADSFLADGCRFERQHAERGDR